MAAAYANLTMSTPAYANLTMSISDCTDFYL